MIPFPIVNSHKSGMKPKIAEDYKSFREIKRQEKRLKETPGSYHKHMRKTVTVRKS